MKYHPDSQFLTDYTAGNLPVAQAMCVNTHLHYCAACRVKVRELSSLGASLFMDQEPTDMTTEAFTQLMTRVDALGNENSTGVSGFEQSAQYPPAINKLAGENLEHLNWHKLGKHVAYSRIDNNRDRTETAFLKINAGGCIPGHSHTGDEITVILKGSFSDQEDCYRRGDFIVRSRGESHRPVASQDEDCYCLICLDSPIRMNHWIHRLLQPLFSMKTG